MLQGGKVSIGSFPLVMPIPVVLVGAAVAGRPNFEAVGNCSIAGFDPGLVFISSVRSHHTNAGIIANGTFSVNVVTEDMVALADCCGIVSGRDYDKGSLFTTYYGKLQTAPLIGESPIALECRVVHAFQYGAMDMFVGEVVDAYVDRELARWMPDPRPGTDPSAGHWRIDRTAIARVRPLVFGHDSYYYGVGPAVGRGYHDGKDLVVPRVSGGKVDGREGHC